MPKVIALVPMKHHSERVPGKNFRSFGGIPLYHRVVKSLLNSPLIDQIVIDTDSEIIEQDVSQNFPEVILLKRPENLRGDTVPMNDILLYDVSQVEGDFYLQTHSTNPLLTHKTINNAIELFLANYPIYDSLFGVTRLQTRLWDSLTRAVNHNPAILLRTQDLPPIYEENSCLYIFNCNTLEFKHNRIGDRPLMFEIDKLEALDIDQELDFVMAEFLYQQGEKQS
jgi:CMP-N-acetylneuraminic acid synthetase